MGGTTTGVLLILGIGLSLLALASWADWRADRRAREAMAAAPDRGEPLQGLATPEYVQQPEAPTRALLTDAERQELEEQLSGSGVHELTAALADLRLVTHSQPNRAILRGPLVMVCPEGIGTVREVLPTLERVLAQRSSLLLAAPTLDAELLDMLHANAARGLRVAPIRAGATTCVQLCELTGAEPVTRADLQAGYVPHSAYGRALLVTASQDGCTLVVP